MSSETRGLGVAEPTLDHLTLSNGREGSYAEGYSAGDVISGKYRLLRPIGRGGMGVIWEAHSEVLDIRVAVKLIQQFSTSIELHQRLLLEARSAARLVDPGVIRIFDCGETPKGDPYIVMELLEGEDLATRLERRGRLPAIEAIRTLLPIVRALGAAHNANIVHRDVKPENVFFTKSLTAEEQPKLFDFGIAKVDVSWEKRLTQAGSTLGSPSYMSPEQAQGNEIDPRSDLWGITVVLYESITGQLPFDGQSYQAIVHAILCADVKPFRELDINEPELWNIIAKGLERDRDLRWQSSSDLAEALGAWLIDRGIMHDVSGVSLHATHANQRVRQPSSGEAARHPNRSGNQVRAARAAISSTVSRDSLRGKWIQSPRRVRYILAMLMLGVFSALLSYGIKKSLVRTNTNSPSQSAKGRADTPPITAPIAQRTTQANEPLAPSQASASNPVGLEPLPSASKTSKLPLPTAKPSKAKAKTNSSKAEQFRSPFD